MTSVQPLGKSSRAAILTYLAASAAVFLLMMIVGLVMRASQAQIIGDIRLSIKRGTLVLLTPLH